MTIESHTTLKPLVVAALLAAAGASPAAVSMYTSQSAWTAAVTAIGTDTFESIVDNSAIAGPTTRLTSSGTSYGYAAAASPTSSLLYSAGSAADRWLSIDVPSDTLRLAPIGRSATAVGGLFFGSDASGAFLAGGSMTVTVIAGADTSSQTVTGATATSFIGFTTTSPITSIQVRSDYSSTLIWPTVNNLSFGAALLVPEPGTWAMWLTGAAVLVLRRRAGQPS